MRAQTDHPINDLLAQRWSPYVYADRAVPEVDLKSLFEAARWAPSSYNEQPWAYIVARKEDTAEFERLLSCLVEANQQWAKHVPVLALGLARLAFQKNNKPNRHAFHDLGLASASLCVEATVRGLVVHQMAGIEPQRAREVFNIPEGWEAVTGIAIGYAGPPETGEEAFRQRDTARRSR
ncbi:MAG: nitroreductase family protein, partial [Candidatus Hydrogenedentes bacterium]|nr:nitroreductase family protein [Candidatus Hydrogenedentota bacterium]